MANATINYLGVPDGGSPTSAYSDDKYQQFYDDFSGEVLTAFNQKHVFGALHKTRTITNAKGARFPATWKATAGYHTPGVPLLGNTNIPSNKRLILVDGLLVSNIFIDELEELMNEYEVRAEYSKQIGEALADEFDSRVAQVIIKASRASGTIGGSRPSPGGSTITQANAKTDSATLVAAYWKANELLDSKNVPDSERYGALLPAQYYMLVQDETVQNTRFGGHGMMMQGNVPYIGDISIVKTNNLPQSNITASEEGEKNDYTGDFSNVATVIWHKSAAGTVKLMDVKTEMTDPDGDFYKMYQGHMITGKYSVGHGILRPECSIEVVTA